MRILFVINSLAPGGTEQSTVVLAPTLAKLGVETTIVTMKAAEHQLNDVAQAAGTRVIQLAPGNLLRQVRELRRLIRSERPDVVHTALFEADQLGRLAAIGTRVPVMSSMVSTPYDDARLADPNVSRPKLRAVQLIDIVTGRMLVDRFHSVSQGVKDANVRALRLPPNRVTVAERGRDTRALGEPSPARRARVRAVLGVAEETPMVINLGRQEHQKAQLDLIRAARLVRDCLPGFLVLIAGKDGAATAAIHQLLQSDHALEGCVRLLGHRTDVGDLLAAADALVISSRFEGTAGAALEAMAMATPIVSTDLEGLRGVLDHGRNALLVAPGDPSALAHGIIAALTDRAGALERSEVARRDFFERFTLAAAGRRFRQLYADVAARRIRTN